MNNERTNAQDAAVKFNNPAAQFRRNDLEPAKFIGTFTPNATADPGSFGQICFDDQFIYIRTSVGWKRAALSSF